MKHHWSSRTCARPGYDLPPAGAVLAWEGYDPGYPNPVEAVEHKALVVWLARLKLVHTHPHNGGLSVQEKAKRKALGERAGVSDLLVFNPPPTGGNGCAIEMKRRDRGEPVSREQVAFLEDLRDRCGWRVFVCPGLDDALDALRICGWLAW